MRSNADKTGVTSDTNKLVVAELATSSAIFRPDSGPRSEPTTSATGQTLGSAAMAVPPDTGSRGLRFAIVGGVVGASLAVLALVALDEGTCHAASRRGAALLRPAARRRGDGSRVAVSVECVSFRRVGTSGTHRLRFGRAECDGASGRRAAPEVGHPRSPWRGRPRRRRRSPRARFPRGSTMASRRTLGIALLLASLTATTAAHADPTSADRETARTLMQQGRELRDQGRPERGAQAVQGRRRHHARPDDGPRGRPTRVAIGQLVEARDFIAAIRQTPPKPASLSPSRTRAPRRTRSTPRSTGASPRSSITVKGAPEGEQAAVSVDGARFLPASLGLPRSRRSRAITSSTAKSRARRSAEGKQEVDVREGEQKPVEVTLIVDGHSRADRESSRAPPPRPRPRAHDGTSHSPTVITWVGVGLAGAGVIAGTVTGVLSMSKKSALQSECPNDVCGPRRTRTTARPTRTRRLDHRVHRRGRGGGLAAVTLIVGHEERAPRRRAAGAEGLVVRPWLGVGAGGLARHVLTCRDAAGLQPAPLPRRRGSNPRIVTSPSPDPSRPEELVGTATLGCFVRLAFEASCRDFELTHGMAGLAVAEVLAARAIATRRVR